MAFAASFALFDASPVAFSGALRVNLLASLADTTMVEI
jgi:hypothetical protein